MPSGAQGYDQVSIARTKDGKDEVWVKRTLSFEGKSETTSTAIQFLIFHTDTKVWNAIPDDVDDSSAKSGILYLSKRGMIWAELGYASSSHFVSYNDTKESFEYVEGSESVPDNGVRLLDDAGKFWILNNHDGIYSFDTISHEVKRYINIPDLETGSTLYGSMSSLAPDGSIYYINLIGDSKTELMHFIPRTGQIEAVSYVEYLGGMGFNLFVDHSGNLWLDDLGWMDVNGIWYKIVRSPIFITDRAESAMKLTWARPSIVVESSDGRLWFQSDNGMAWLDPLIGKWCWFTTERSNIVEDQEHNLWMIANGNLYKYPLNP